MKRRWAPDELIQCWALSERERRELLTRRNSTNGWAVAIALKHYELIGRFPRARRDIPISVSRFVAEQLRVPESDVERFDWSSRTAKRHRGEILAFLGMRRANTHDRGRLRTWLLDEVVPQDLRSESVLERIQTWHQAEGIALPGPVSLDRLVRSVTHRFEAETMQCICGRLDDSTKAGLEKLLSEDAEFGLRELKVDPGRASVESVRQCVTRLRRIKGFGLSSETFAGVPEPWLEAFRKRVANETLWEVRRHPEAVRTALLATFCWVTQQRLADDLAELAIAVIRKISARAEKRVERTLLKTFRVRHKYKVLVQLARLLVNNSKGQVDAVVFPVVGEETLKAIILEAETGKTYEAQVHTVVRSSYCHHYRQIMPLLLEVLDFRATNPQHRAVVDALAWLREHHDDSRRLIPTDELPTAHLLNEHWEEIVIDVATNGDRRINRINYEICVLNALRAGLRCKAIWILGAYRYRDPDQDLPQDFEDRRSYYFAELDQPEDPTEFTSRLRAQTQPNPDQFQSPEGATEVWATGPNRT